MLTLASDVPPNANYYYGLDFFGELPPDVQVIQRFTPFDPTPNWIQDTVFGSTTLDKTVIGYTILSDMDLSFTLEVQCQDSDNNVINKIPNDLYSGYTTGYYPGIISSTAQFHCDAGNHLVVNSDGNVEAGGIGAAIRVYYVDRDTREEQTNMNMTNLIILIFAGVFLLGSTAFAIKKL